MPQSVEKKATDCIHNRSDLDSFFLVPDPVFPQGRIRIRNSGLGKGYRLVLTDEGKVEDFPWFFPLSTSVSPVNLLNTGVLQDIRTLITFYYLYNSYFFLFMLYFDRFWFIVPFLNNLFLFRKGIYSLCFSSKKYFPCSVNFDR